MQLQQKLTRWRSNVLQRKMSADVARRIAEISEVLDGTSRGTFHGATPGQRPITGGGTLAIVIRIQMLSHTKNVAVARFFAISPFLT
jgi:hypothetical protein